MDRPEVILPRFQKLDEYLSVLENLQQYGQEEFLDDPEHYGSAERFLQLAIEALNDIGNHIVATEGWRGIDRYSDIPRRLREHGIIDETMKEHWIQMVGFRNVLVHDYVDLNRRRVYEVLQHNLADLMEIKKALAEML
ncbi:MAG: DUF86 domain-containing protein [Planctomycetes bacterium]|nr:DUF86 domain-containing protein [Planctomycetota bacterium]